MSAGQKPQNVPVQQVDLGSFLRPVLTEAIQAEVLMHLREQEAKPENVNADRLAGDIQNALEAKVFESLGVDSAFWNTLHRDPSVRDKFAGLALTPENVSPMTDFALEQYEGVGQEIARSLLRAFPAPLNTPGEGHWKKQQSAIQQTIESQLKARDTVALSRCNQKLDEILEAANVKDAAAKEEAKKALFSAVAKRRAALDAEANHLSQFDRDKQKAADEEKSKQSKPQAQQQQQSAGAEQGGSDFDKWMRQRDYQGQNLVVSMVLALVLSKGPLNIIDYIGCILTGGADGLLRKWKMLEYQGMTFHNQLASEKFNPLDGGADAPRARTATDEQGGATAAQNAVAQQANAGNAAAQAANRPKPQQG